MTEHWLFGFRAECPFRGSMIGLLGAQSLEQGSAKEGEQSPKVP
jgi:hypothetical protein